VAVRVSWDRPTPPGSIEVDPGAHFGGPRQRLQWFSRRRTGVVTLNAAVELGSHRSSTGCGRTDLRKSSDDRNDSECSLKEKSSRVFFAEFRKARAVQAHDLNISQISEPSSSIFKRSETKVQFGIHLVLEPIPVRRKSDLPIRVRKHELPRVEVRCRHRLQCRPPVWYQSRFCWRILADIDAADLIQRGLRRQLGTSTLRADSSSARVWLSTYLIARSRKRRGSKLVIVR